MGGLFPSLLTDGKEGERAREEEEGSEGTEATVGNDDDDDEANASVVWIPLVCLMAVTKEEVGRTPTVERAANLSAGYPSWREKAVKSVNKMSSILKERRSMVMILGEIFILFLLFEFVCVCERERARIYKFWFLLRFFFFWKRKESKGFERREMKTNVPL